MISVFNRENSGTRIAYLNSQLTFARVKDFSSIEHRKLG